MSGKKTKKTDKSQEIFRPGTEEREIFSLILSIIAELLNEKKIEFNIDSSGDLEFSLDPSEIKDCVSEEIKDKLSFEDFIKTISTEIESLVEASIYSDKAKGIKNNIPPTILKEVGVDEFLWRLVETEKVINVPKALKQDSIFKKTTKGRILKGVNWEISNKTFDEELGQLDNLKYATLSILYSQPGIEAHSAKLLLREDFSIQLPIVPEPKQITLELQKKDITRLIDNLQQILDTF
jgi:hypothetical protein